MKRNIVHQIRKRILSTITTPASIQFHIAFTKILLTRFRSHDNSRGPLSKLFFKLYINFNPVTAIKIVLPINTKTIPSSHVVNRRFDIVNFRLTYKFIGLELRWLEYIALKVSSPTLSYHGSCEPYLYIKKENKVRILSSFVLALGSIRINTRNHYKNTHQNRLTIGRDVTYACYTQRFRRIENLIFLKSFRNETRSLHYKSHLC